MVFKNKISTNISETTDFIFSALTFVFEKKGCKGCTTIFMRKNTV